MRIATYNTEWFNTLFDDTGQLIDDDSWSARYNVTKAMQTQALGRVFQALDADGVMIIEAPDSNRNRNTVVALENFAAHFGLRARAALVGFTNDTQQEIAFLHDPDILTTMHAPVSTYEPPAAPRFDQSFEIDLDIDAQADTVTFSKPPLEVLVETTTGKLLRMIGVHAKSKAAHGARDAAHAMRLSIANRRKQLAQCIWLRRRVASHLQAKDSLIVLGDFNDGPGLDEYEALFGKSSVEIVLGLDQARDLQLYDPHAAAALQQRLGVRVSTSRFYLRKEKRYLNALLDYIMVSPDLKDLSPDWQVWHPFDDPACFDTPELSHALLTASDHFPVTLDIDL
ncbi:MAG: endonuclease [Pseudomonadota bacterium]